MAQPSEHLVHVVHLPSQTKLESRAQNAPMAGAWQVGSVMCRKRAACEWTMGEAGVAAIPGFWVVIGRGVTASKRPM